MLIVLVASTTIAINISSNVNITNNNGVANLVRSFGLNSH